MNTADLTPETLRAALDVIAIAEDRVQQIFDIMKKHSRVTGNIDNVDFGNTIINITTSAWTCGGEDVYYYDIPAEYLYLDDETIEKSYAQHVLDEKNAREEKIRKLEAQIIADKEREERKQLAALLEKYGDK
jgi:hypothetical protein